MAFFLFEGMMKTLLLMLLVSTCCKEAFAADSAAGLYVLARDWSSFSDEWERPYEEALGELLGSPDRVSRSAKFLVRMVGTKRRQAGLLGWPDDLKGRLFYDLATSAVLNRLLCSGDKEKEAAFFSIKTRFRFEGKNVFYAMNLEDGLQCATRDERWRFADLLEAHFGHDTWILARLVMENLHAHPEEASSPEVLHRIKKWGLEDYVLRKISWPREIFGHPCSNEALEMNPWGNGDSLTGVPPVRCDDAELDGDGVPETAMVYQSDFMGGSFSALILRGSDKQELFRSGAGQHGAIHWLTSTAGTFVFTKIENPSSDDPSEGGLTVYRLTEGKFVDAGHWEGSYCVAQVGCNSRVWFRIEGGEAFLERWHSGERLRLSDMADTDYRVSSRKIVLSGETPLKLEKAVWRIPYYLDIYPRFWAQP